MIKTASEFIALRTSTIPEEYQRAGREEAPFEVWMELIENHPEMRFWVACNKTVISKELQTILAKDEDWRVRSQIASKYPLDRGLYEMLSVDKHEAVRNTIVHNKRVPLDILEKIIREDTDEYVVNNAKEIVDIRRKRA